MTGLLRELEAANLIHAAREPEPTFLFKHMLVQETGYQSLLNRDRRELHLSVGAAIEAIYADHLDEYIPACALHYWAGEHWAKAAYYARLAGERALRVYALREAKGYFAQARQALERMPDAAAGEVCDAILGWTQAAFGFEPFPSLLEQLARAETLARQMQDKRRLALVLHTTGKVHVASGHALRAGPPLVECFALVDELGDESLALMPTYYMGMATQSTAPRDSLAWFDRAAELGRKYGDVDIQAYAISAKAMVLARLGEAEGARASLEQAFRLVPDIQSPMCDSDVHLFSAMAYLDLGDVPHALEYAKLGVAKALSADNMECACFGFACLGFGHMRAEHIEEATQAFEEAIRRSRYSGAEESEIMGEAGLGMAHLYAGRAEGLQEVEAALAHAQRMGDPQIVAMLEQMLGETYLKQGDAERALACLRHSLGYLRQHMVRPELARTLELIAEALERLQESDRAHEIREERSALLGGAPLSSSPASTGVHSPRAA